MWQKYDAQKKKKKIKNVEWQQAVFTYAYIRTMYMSGHKGKRDPKSHAGVQMQDTAAAVLP